MHEIPLITTIALALSGALSFGLIARRLWLSPIVGYLVAGVLIGPMLARRDQRHGEAMKIDE
jgi:CPA2 family monovalent cation:H+ antiporter-2